MIQPTNFPITDIEKTISYFSTLYDQPIEITQNVLDALYAFFLARTNNQQTAKAFVHSVIVTALSTKTNPITLIEKFNQISDTLSVDAQLAAFLNLSRANTSMLGVTNNPQTNKYILRTIKA